MTDARPSPLIFYVLIVATFALTAGVIWFVLTFSLLSIALVLPAAGVVGVTGMKICA